MDRTTMEHEAYERKSEELKQKIVKAAEDLVYDNTHFPLHELAQLVQLIRLIKRNPDKYMAYVNTLDPDLVPVFLGENDEN